MWTYTDLENTMLAKRNSGQNLTLTEKRSSYLEKDCFEKSQKYCSRGDRTAELNIHSEDPVSTKTVRYELHKSNIHGSAAIAKPPLIKNNSRMCKRWCPVTAMKPGHQTTGKAHVIWSDESSFTLFPTSRRVHIYV
jgi:hypothetical protein